MLFGFRLLSGALLILLLAGSAYAEGGLLGDWGGAKPTMEEKGLTLEIVYTGETVRNFDPGLVTGTKESVYHDYLDMAMTFDTEAAGLWSGGTLFVHGIRNHGGDPTGNVIGDLQTASNIEAPNQTILHEAWYEQQFADGTFSILVGLHDLNSEFYVSEYAGLYLNSSFGIGPEVSANVPASLYPQAGLAARIRYAPSDNAYISAAVYDGDPSTRKLSKLEGRMEIAEIGFTYADKGMPGSLKVGGWRHTADFISPIDGNPYTSNNGFYLVAEQQFAEWDDGGFGMFLQIGTTPKNRNVVPAYRGIGMNFSGLLSGFENEFGVALAMADTQFTPGVITTERVLEATYNIVLIDGISLHPSYQHIKNPGGIPSTKTMRVGLLRFEAAL